MPTLVVTILQILKNHNLFGDKAENRLKKRKSLKEYWSRDNPILTREIFVKLGGRIHRMVFMTAGYEMKTWDTKQVIPESV